MPFLTPLSANTLERSPGRRTAPGKSPLKPAKSPLKPAKSQLKPAESLKAAQPEEVRVFGVGGVLQEVRGATPAANKGEGRAARAPTTDPEEGCAEWTAEAWAEWEGEWSAEEWSEWEGQWTAEEWAAWDEEWEAWEADPENGEHHDAGEVTIFGETGVLQTARGDTPSGHKAEGRLAAAPPARAMRRHSLGDAAPTFGASRLDSPNESRRAQTPSDRAAGRTAALRYLVPQRYLAANEAARRGALSPAALPKAAPTIAPAPAPTDEAAYHTAASIVSGLFSPGAEAEAKEEATEKEAEEAAVPEEAAAARQEAAADDGWEERVGSKPARHLAGKALSLMGNGFIAHIEPAGYMPSVTYVPLISSMRPSLHRSSCDPSKARCLWRKHSSVSASPFGHSRNAYPPPWLARMKQPVCPSPPAAHTTPVGASGSLEPACCLGGRG